MSIKNYTSQVGAERSITLIEHCLVSAGASHIAKSYDIGHECPSAVIFQMKVENGMFLTFKLPARVGKVYDKLYKAVRRPRAGTKKTVMEQATRTAWKLVYDQVAVLTANILIDQQDPAEAFFPYLYDGRQDKTIYELARDNNFKALPIHQETNQ